MSRARIPIRLYFGKAGSDLRINPSFLHEKIYLVCRGNGHQYGNSSVGTGGARGDGGCCFDVLSKRTRLAYATGKLTRP